MILVCFSVTGVSLFFLWYLLDKKRRKVLYLKKRIAADLHDSMGSNLNQINVIAGQLRDRPFSEEELVKEANRIVRVCNTTLSNLSDIIWSLDKEVVDLEELIERIKDYADDFFLPLGIPFDLIIDSELDTRRKLGQGMGYQLMLVFKEAFVNIVKHTRSTKVEVFFLKIGKGVKIKISNRFIDKQTAKHSTHLGLVNMKRRIEMLHGAIKFEDNIDLFTISIDLKKL